MKNESGAPSVKAHRTQGDDDEYEFESRIRKIYQFPAGGRSGVSARRQGETQASPEIASPRVSEVAVGGACITMRQSRSPNRCSSIDAGSAFDANASRSAVRFQER